MVMKALREGASGGFLKFILLGFMAMAVGGLVLMDMGGFFRGGVSRTDVANVGGQKISIRSFDRVVRRTLPQLGISPQDAYRFGYIEQLLGGEIRKTLLQRAAREHDIMVGKQRLAQEIKTIIQPLAGEGQNEQDVLNQILVSQGMGEKEFINAIAQEIGSNLLSTAIQNGFADFSDALYEDLYRFQKEKRTFSYVIFLDKDVKDLPAPNETQLLNLYEATKEEYAIPEYRAYTLIEIDDSALKKALQISEEEITDTYESNIGLYTTPATRTLEQGLFESQEQARAVAAAVQEGAKLEKAIKDITGKSTAYLGKKDMQDSDLIEAIKEPVLAASEKSVIGPLQTPLGWYVIHVSSINEPRVKPLKEVKEEIREDLYQTQLIDQIYDMANMIDDLLAGGATLEELREAVDVEITELPPIDNLGRDQKGQSTFKDKDTLQAAVLDTGTHLLEGETSAVLEMENGKFIAINLRAIQPKTYKDFASVEKNLRARWEADQKRMTNLAQTENIVQDMRTNGKNLKEAAGGKSVQSKSLVRDQQVESPFLPISASGIFQAPLNLPIIIDVVDGKAVAVVENSELLTGIDPENADFIAMQSNIVKGAQNEGMMLYLSYLQQKYRASINKPLLNQVYGPESVQY